MFVELSVNERGIGTIGIWNTGVTRNNGNTIYEVFDLSDEDSEIEDLAPVAEVAHDPSDGASELIARTMIAIDEDELLAEPPSE